MPGAPKTVLAAAAVLLAVAAIAGCGSGGDETATTAAGNGKAASTTSTTERPPAPPGSVVHTCTSPDVASLRASGASCDTARDVASAWTDNPHCGAARTSRPFCSVGRFRCLGAKTDRGIVASCQRMGVAISFIAKRD